MCLPIPHLIGGIEVEERRPRTWNEPRRKRLNFIKDRNRRSDEWALTPNHQPNPYPRNEQERWDLRQFEAQQRFQQRQLQFEHHRRMQHHQQMQQLHGPPMPPGWQGQQQPGRPQQPLQQARPMHPLQNRAHHGSSDDIVQIVSGSDDSDDDHRPSRRQRQPKLIEVSPRVPLPRQFEMKGGKKGNGGKKHKGREVESESSDSEASFVRVVRRTRSKSRGHSRPRSRARFVDDDSSDDSFAELGRRLCKGRRGRW
ncbi:MAG: hypothetical protein Q9164_001041 [Protoblastenia rupestris]